MTLPVGLATAKSAYGLQYAQNMATSILAALPLVLVFLFFQLAASWQLRHTSAFEWGQGEEG